MANRRKQIEAIQNKAEQFAQEIEALVEELEEALENMPDSFRDGERGEAAQERIDTLTEWADQLDEMVAAVL